MTPPLMRFFRYFGSKHQNAAVYPAPQHGTIVEPFAGSAGYSCRYPDRRVILVDTDPIVAGVWRYLIRASEREILSLPDLPYGSDVRDLRVPLEARWLIGFWINPFQTTRPSTRYSRGGRETDGFWGPEVRARIASQLPSIRHWEVRRRGYDWCPDIEATWFVDPPYRGLERFYRFGPEKLDFAHLGDWCRSRRGQTIVCETGDAAWLPFRKRDAYGDSRELVWEAA